MLNAMSQVDTLSDDEIMDMMSEVTPPGTPNAKDLIATTEPVKQPEVVPDRDPKEPLKPLNHTIETLEQFEEGEGEETQPEPDPNAEPTQVTPEKKTKAPSRGNAINYKDAVEFLIEKGVFEDFEDKDKIEYTSETFAELLEAQAKHKADTTINEKINSLGEVAKQIIQYESNGGDPRYILEAFQEQKDIQNLDIEQPENQVEIIREYYSRAGKSKIWIDKQINILKEEGEQALKDEALENQKLILEQIQDEIQVTQKEQAEWDNRRKDAENQFNQGVRKLIHTDDLAERDKKELEKFFFEYKYPLPNGRKVNELYKKWMDIQNDPKKYYKFVKFVKDFEKFDDTTKVQKEITKKTFNFLREAQGDSSKKTTSTPDYQESSKNKVKNPFTFKF